MRVVMFLTGDAPFGAAWAEAAGLVAEVVTVDVVRTVSDGSTADNRVRRPRLGPKRLVGRVFDRVLAGRIEGALEQIQAQHGPIDVLHTHFYPSARLLPAISQRMGIPFVHTEHSSSLTPRADSSKGRTARGLQAAAASYAAATTVIAVSDYLRRCIELLGLGGQIEVVGNPIDVDLFRPVERPVRDEIRLVTVGRLEPDKRPEWVLEAFAAARRTDQRLRLEFVGDGADADTQRAFARDLGLADAVTFAGALPHHEVADRVADADLFVCASRTETFGMAVAEALSAGVPIVAPRVGALPELVQADWGVLVDEDPVSLSAGVHDAVARLSDFDRDGMARAMRQRFAPAAVAARLADIYDHATRQVA